MTKLSIADGHVGGSLNLKRLQPLAGEVEVENALNTSEENDLHFFEMFDIETQTRIIMEAETYYDQWTNDVKGKLIPFGGEAVSNLNRITELLLKEVEPVDIEKVDELSGKLVSDMAELKQYDLRQKEVLETVQNLGRKTRRLWQKAKSSNYAQDLLEAAHGREAAIKGLLKELNVEFERMLRNAEFLEHMYAATGRENVNLIYHLAILERVRLLAQQDKDDLAKETQLINNARDNQRSVGDLTAFIHLLDNKTDGLRSRLVMSTQNAPDIRDMHVTMVGMASALWTLEELAVPGMQGTLLKWIFQATALQAGHLKEMASNTVQDWMVAGAEASAENIPAAMKVAFKPILEEEAIDRINELQKKKEEGKLTVGVEAKEKLERARIALERLRDATAESEMDMAMALDPEMEERVGRLSNY